MKIRMTMMATTARMLVSHLSNVSGSKAQQRTRPVVVNFCDCHIVPHLHFGR